MSPTGPGLEGGSPGLTAAVISRLGVVPGSIFRVVVTKHYGFQVNWSKELRVDIAVRVCVRSDGRPAVDKAEGYDVPRAFVGFDEGKRRVGDIRAGTRSGRVSGRIGIYQVVTIQGEQNFIGGGDLTG